MPQFDFFTFFVQIFWFTVAIFCFYLLYLKFYLKNTAEIIKIRQKLLSFLDYIYAETEILYDSAFHKILARKFRLKDKNTKLK